ncbi:glycoside hydrolase family 97 protein [Aquimarina sp. MMG016]|uniref:glycoside hydrolase family 97 protein n=1 Tax=Aquimarina sp. MMG016 TaxID=2822690 RepID=UPI001B3A70FB|nr:glycoside hydrolase family 97 protein [Aquimarina sp. MMG016]MBQ4821375.1 glycoside hydrolase family 97 protein [Aquimarina sp. MMG016]
MIYRTNLKLLWLLLATIHFMSCQQKETNIQTTVYSPSKNISVDFSLLEDGSPYYVVKHKTTKVIDTSKIGFTLKNEAPLEKGFKIIGSTLVTEDENWEMPWGEQRSVRNHYNEVTIQLQEEQAPNRLLTLYFRAYNDGVAYRYEFPEQKNLNEVIILDENSQFNLTGDHKTWWIPGDWDIYEHLYTESNFTEIDALAKRGHKALAQTSIPENAVNTPVTMRTADGLHLSFHEANLTDYSGMTLKIDKNKLMMTSELVGSDRSGYKVKRELPFKTPWRTIQISNDAAGLIESNLIVNLNEPNKLGDTSWFTPMKYVGIWWEMHLDKSSWDLKSGKHGATTENTKAHIDFAAENNIGGVLVEGWNTGWEHWIGFEDREGVFDFVTPYPDYNLQEVAQYAKDKNVQIIMHHETSAAPRTYDKRMDTAYALMNKLDIRSVKTGYVGKIIPKGEYHHGQWMVNHYRRALETAAKYNVAINAHEPIKPTGIRRTYPNAISREGLRGQEFNAWAPDGGNPPDHLPTVAFTRMLAGPIDFTPGVFNIKLKPYKPDNQINTTLAHQLGLYVVIYSPIQMACDLLEHYNEQPAFQFIKDVGVDWEQTKVLNGEVGDFVTIARQERKTGNWFVGAITDENQRDIKLNFDFLEPEKEYEAKIYKDGSNAHWNDNPTSIDIETKVINSTSKETIMLAPGGGLAISLIPKK